MVPVTQKIARHAAAAVAVCLVLPLASLAAADKPTYTERKEQVKLPNRSIEFRCAKPNSPRAPAFLVIFASGDAGLRLSSGAVYKHLAERGQYVAAYSSKEAIAQHKGGNFMTLQEAAADIAAMMREGKRLLDLPESTPTVVTGMSRGASMVVFAAAEPTLRADIAGGIAIALTKESDYVKAPAPDTRTPFTTLDEKGRILTYPLLDSAGLNADRGHSIDGRQVHCGEANRARSWVPTHQPGGSSKSRPENHSFRGGEDKMLQRHRRGARLDRGKHAWCTLNSCRLANHEEVKAWGPPRLSSLPSLSALFTGRSCCPTRRPGSSLARPGSAPSWSICARASRARRRFRAARCRARAAHRRRVSDGNATAPLRHT